MNVRTLPTIGAATHEVAPWIELFARIGFAAKGILYLTIGGLAASAAVGMGGKSNPDSHSALQKLFAVPFGRALVAVIAFGLLGYAAWRIIEGITDPQRRGTSAKGIAIRASYIARGLIHLTLAFAAAALAIWQQKAHGANRVEEWTRIAMGWPGGSYVLWAVAGGLLGYGIYQLYCAIKSKLSRQLELGRVSGDARRAIIAISRFGIAARGIVFCTIAVLISRAARDHNPKAAGGVGESMRELVWLGKGPYLAIALGLAAYGIYEIISSKYRRIAVA